MARNYTFDMWKPIFRIVELFGCDIRFRLNGE